MTIFYSFSVNFTPHYHVARAWPNSKYEDINEILYHPSTVPARGGPEQLP